MRTIALILGFVAVLMFLPIRNGVAQSSSCLANPDTAAMLIGSVKDAVTWGDSAKLVQQGIPYKPAQGVTLVTSTQVCSKIVAAYNAPVPAGDPRRISQAYVMKVGNNVYAAVGSKTPANKLVMYFYDNKYKSLAALVDM